MPFPAPCLSTLIQCSFGLAPGTLMVLPLKLVLVDGRPIACNIDFVPFLNIMPFGMCQSMANPMVVAATAAAFGVLTPMPCIPAIVSPWTPQHMKIKVRNIPTATMQSKCTCAYAGQVSIIMVSQMKVMQA